MKGKSAGFSIFKKETYFEVYLRSELLEKYYWNYKKMQCKKGIFFD